MRWLPACLWIVALSPACGSSKVKPTYAASGRDGRDDAQAETASPESGAPDDGAPDANVPGDVGNGDGGTIDRGSDASDTSSTGDGDAADTGAHDGLADGTADGSVDLGPQPASGSPFRALAIATGAAHTCALLDNHRIKCWGANGFGALGVGDIRLRGAAAEMGDALPFVDLGTGRTATAISAGRNQSCAILDDGSVKCWGWRSLTGLPLPPAAAGQFGIGDEPGEMGDALPALDLGPGRTATHLACGYSSSCAVLDDSSARCWGGANLLPTATTLESTSKVRQLAPAKDGAVALFEDGSLSNVLPGNATSLALAPNEKATYVAGAWMYLCATLDGGGVKCDPPSASGVPPTTTSTDLSAIGVGLGFSCGLSGLGDVRCWGFSKASYWCPDAVLPDGSCAVALGQKALALTTGNFDHTCALLADGGVKCWSTYDTCVNSAGGADICPVPATPNLLLGSSVDIVGTGATRKVGAWHPVNLGTHP
jgi:hypothetical protein